MTPDATTLVFVLIGVTLIAAIIIRTNQGRRFKMLLGGVAVAGLMIALALIADAFMN
jgi:hypothetical protein